MDISIPILQMRKLRLWGSEELPQGNTATNCEGGTGNREKTNQSAFGFIGRNPSQTNLGWKKEVSVQVSSVAQSCPTLCDPMDCSTPGLPVHHQLLESTQTHVHRVDDAILSSHPLSSPSPPTFSLSQHQGLFQWVSSSHQVAKVLQANIFLYTEISSSWW